MKVKELMGRLKYFDPETEVVIEEENRKIGEVWEMQNSETNMSFCVLEEV